MMMGMMGMMGKQQAAAPRNRMLTRGKVDFSSQQVKCNIKYEFLVLWAYGRQGARDLQVASCQDIGTVHECTSTLFAVVWPWL